MLFVGVAIYQFDQRLMLGVYGVLQLLAALLAVLLFCQRYSELGGVPLAALFLIVRCATGGGHTEALRSIDLRLRILLSVYYQG